MKRSNVLRLIAFSIFIFIMQLFIFNGKVYAAWQVKSPYNNTDIYYTNIHLYVDGEEIEPDDPNVYKKFISLYPASNNVKGGTLPDSKVDQEPGDYGTDWETGKYQIITNKAGDRGVIEWYDNPEFNGEPISTFLFNDYPDGSSFYAKTGPIVTTYVNGEERKLVVGRTYSPGRIYDDYYLVKNVFIDKDKQKNIIESDFNDPEHNMFSSNIRSGAKENEYHYFADLTEPLKEGLNAKTPTRVTHYHNYFLPFVNLNDCSKDEDGEITCGIADPNTGETITNGIGLFNSTKYIPFSSVSDLPSYYQILGFVDQYGNNYDERFLVTEDFDNKSLTTIIDSKQTCTASSISTPMAEFGIGSLYNSTIAYNGSYLNVDFDERYFTKKDHWAQLSEYYDDGKVYRSVSTCLPYDVELTSDYYENPKINFDLLVVLQDTNGTKITKNSTYTLPNEGVPKASEVFTYTLKYQDGVTPDENITYTKVYTPNGFKIDGVHYDFGESIIVTRNLYIEYDYDVEIIQDELPTPTRNNYTFKGWFDMSQGGHIVNDLTESNSNILYAQWADKDKVTIIRPDGIATELEKGSEYIIPDIPFKDESLVARVSFVYNDNSGKVDYSSITKTYQKNGVTIKETGTHYNVGDKIIVNENMTLIPDYTETINPATFPSDPERNDYTFLGWYDKLPNGTKYTEYSGDKDLTLYAKWHSNLPEEYTLPEVPSKDNEIVSTVTFKYNNGNEDTTSNVFIGYIPNGYIDNATGNIYEAGDKVTIEDNTDIVPRYIETIIPSEFPSDPTKENYIFQGWYDSNTGGNKYTSYSDINDITLYAHWNSEGGVTPSDDILCKRYSDITHDKTELETGDDFVCDVNGDGLFNEDDEIFYYVSDYYDTTLKEFNSNYAALIYSYSVLSGEIRTFDDGDGNASYNLYQNPAYNGPSSAIRELPTSSEWSNTSLYKNTRSILSVSGENTLNGNTLNSAFSYDGYSSRLLTTQELARGCDIDVTDDNAYIPDKCSFLTININNQIEPGNTGHNYFLENPTGQDEAAMINMGQYRQHNDYFEAMTVRPVIDVPKTRMELGETNTFVITYPDGSTEEVEEGSTFTFPNLPSKENEVISTVTFKYNNGEEDTTSDVLKEFTPNNWTVDSTNYNPGDTLTVTSNITLQANYVETVVGATFPSNPTKENSTFLGWYDSETYCSEVSSYNGNEDITLYAHWINGNDGEYNLGVNDIPKESEIISTVTFKYHNGDSDTTSNVTKSYLPNGWLVDGIHYYNNETIIINKNTVIEPYYNEVISNGEFPSNPTKDGYEFTGWFTEETGGNEVTVLRDLNDIIVHAQYTNSYAYLKDGEQIANATDALVNSLRTKNLVFRKATLSEYNSVKSSLTSSNIISTDDSPKTVYVWLDGLNVLYYSDADTIYMNPDSHSMFYYGLTDAHGYGYSQIDLSGLNSSKVVDMGSLLYGQQSLTSVNLSSFNTSNVTDMSSMFYENKLTSLDLSHFDTSKVTDMHQMFNVGSTGLTGGLNISSFDTSNVTDMSNMFQGVNASNLDLSSFDTSNVTDMSYILSYCENLTILDLSGFNTSKVTNMIGMFSQSNKLTTIYVSELWNTNSVTSTGIMFSNNTYLVGQEGTRYKFNNANDVTYAHVDGGTSNPGYLTLKAPNTHKITYPDGIIERVEDGSSYTFRINKSTKASDGVATVTFNYQNGSENTTSAVEKSYSASGWKYNNTHIDNNEIRVITSDIVLEYDYVETITSAKFPSDPEKEGYVFVGWYTEETGGSKVTSYNEEEDITLYAHWDYNLGINNIQKADDVISVVTFKYHNGDSDTTSNVIKSYVPNGWLVDGVHYSNNSAVEKTTSTVIEPDYKEIIHDATFPNNPTKDGYEFVGWFTEETGGEQVTFLNSDSDISIHAQYTDSYALLDTGPNINPIIFNMMSSVSADYKRFVFRKATQTEYESISDSLTNDNIISLSSSPHEVYLWVEQNDDPGSTANYALLYYSDADIIFMNSDSSSLFENLYSNGKLEIHLSDLNFSKVTNMSKMFMKAGLSILDIDNINTSNVTDMSHMFEQYESYSSTFDLSSLNTSRVTNMSSMFRRNTYLETLDLSNFDTSNVTDMSKMFSTNSLYLKNLDVSNFDTSNVTDMSYMFAYSTYLETLDVSNFDTHNVTNMSNMFASLGKIEELDVSNFDTHNVTDMSYMFANLTIIEELDLSNFDTSNVTNMKEMFYYMTHLTSLNVSNFDTHNVTDMSYMFSNVSSMTSYDLSSFDTSNVTTALRMFENNSSLTSLDLSSFDTSSLTSLREMFANSSSLRTIYVSNLWNLRNDANGYQMFDGDTSLVGQKGTRYKSTNSNSQTYAHVDEGTSNPGYLTYKGKRYITYPDGTIDEVDNNRSYTFRINTSTKEDDILSTATFIFDNGREDYTSNVTKSYIPSGWKYNDTHIDDEETMTITEDIVLDYDYVETIVPCEFPIEPTKAYHTFNGWFNEDTKYTSYDGDEDITLTAKWTKKVNITYPDGTTEKVDSGTIITLDNGTDKEEKYYNITFKYNYENSPSDKVVRISSYDKFIGWLVNDTLYNSGDEIEVTEDITITPKYETIINNNNLPSDPEREGYDFLGWYDGNNIESSNKIDITKVNKQMTLYAGWKVTGEYIVFFDNKKYTFNDGESVNTFDLGYAYNEKNDNYEIVIDYQDNETPIRIVPITITNTFVNWTDENNNEYSEIINLNTDLDGMHFTSHYNEGEFNEIDLSTYYPDTADFAGFYTDRNNGDLVTSITTPQNINLYAHYDENKIAIITLDNEIEVYSIGDTYTLPSDNTKEDDIVVITFDPQNGEEVFTRNITTSYTFNGYRLDTDNTLYEGEHSFTVEDNMTFNSEFSSNTTGDTWPSDPSKDNYIFLGWYTNETTGIEVFNFDGITSNTTLYAHYTTNDESFVTLTNTVTGESVKVAKNTDWVFGDSKFNKDKKDKLGTITYKFNSTGYPDEEIDYYRNSTITGYYIEGDDTLYSTSDINQFTTDTSITPEYNVETDTHVGLDQFDYEVTNGEKRARCFSKTNQTDPNDEEEYTCYTEYNPEDGDVTLYLHWRDIVKVTVTEPNGITKEYEEGDIYNTGVNDSTKDSEGYTVTFKYQDGREDTTQSHMTTYTANGWLINGNHVDDNTDITLEEDIVKEYDYSVDTSTITLPEPTRNGYTFKGWNSKDDGKGITYDNDTINSLNKDTIVYGIWTKDEIVVSFNSHGGSDIDDITYSYDEEYGDLPVPTYDDNHVFDGWYKEDTYENKVSSKTKATEDIELHAKWIEETFPFVYPVHTEPLVCDGSNYVNTGVMLYDDTNWQKDYEIGFTIDEYDSDANETQAVFANTKYEVESLGWPGLTFRKVASKLEITQNINGTKKNVTFGDYAPGYKVRIMRINKTVYYQINDGQVKSLQSMSNFNQQFELPVYFCAGDNGSGGTQRHLKGTISNYYVRRGTYEDLETHTVTYPDGTVETYIHGSVLDLEANESTKASEVVSTVTFKPENGENDIESTVVKNYTPNGFMINGVHYDDESSLVVDEDKVITYSYDEDIDEAIFPDDPEKEHYDFDGWFDGDTEYTEYSGDSDITLTAEYTRRTVTITLPDEPPVVIDEGDSYDLSENTEAKPDDNIAEVTFKYHDDETEDLVRYVTKSYTPNGWIIDGVHYDDYASITPTKDITVIPDYIETINGAEFPSNPSRDNYEFMGWFTEETSGEKVTSYDGENDIILHAQWDMTLPTDFDIDSDDVLMVKGETHQIEVTFIPDGTSDTISYTSSDDNIATVSSDGLITAVDKGVITIIVSLDNVDVEKIITVTVVSDKLESETYDVLDKEKEDQTDDRIVIGAEPGTTIQEFKENMLNPVNYIKIYDGDTELSEDDIVKTGLTIKLEINGIVHDEAIIIVRGDINEDGLVNVIDKSLLSEHVLRLNNIEGYRTYAADVDNNDIINVIDKSKLSEYILRLIDSLNE